jgi:hypothetical protein
VMLPIAPRELLHHNSLAVAAIDTPHDVDKEHGNLPQRYDLEPPSFRKMVIHGAFTPAPGTPWRGTLSRTNVDVKLPAILRHRHVFVNVSPEFPDLVQDRLQLHLAGSQSRTYVCNCLMTDPQDVFPPRLRESSFLDLP